MFINQHKDNNSINQTACVIFLGIILIAWKEWCFSEPGRQFKEIL